MDQAGETETETSVTTGCNCIEGGRIRLLARTKRIALLSALLIFGARVDLLTAHAASQPGLAGSTVLIIRHAEKPSKKSGMPDLKRAGEARANAYVDYFQNLKVDGAPIHIDAVIAAADSKRSMRSRLTLEPLSRATGLPIQQPFSDQHVHGLVKWLSKGQPRRTIVIAWHKGQMPHLLTELGADPNALLPAGKWPSHAFDWVIVLRYDEHGRLSESRRIVEPNASAAR
jgi:hypothetical protein